mgnify:CR=1 FL=1
MIKIFDSNCMRAGKTFVIDTNRTTYAFTVLPSGHLMHLYYGATINMDNDGVAATAGTNKYLAGNIIAYSKEYSYLGLEDTALEVSTIGKGDIREPQIFLTNIDSSTSNDFIYQDYEYIKGYASDGWRHLSEMPEAHSGNEQLIITMKDSQRNIYLELIYVVFEKTDCITRRVRIINKEETFIDINRALSINVDLPGKDMEMLTFTGAWTREMNLNVTKVTQNKLVNSSFTGTSSNRNNPFVILKKKDTTDFAGEGYGFNILYSGNHYSCAEKNGYGKLRFVMGINPNNFRFRLEPDKIFETPEVVMSFAKNGLNDLSHNFHDFVREYVVRRTWAKKVRPVLLNSWEACYFKFNENKLLNMAKKAKDIGVELFVLDDGWFGERNSDDSSLGDWDVNLKKLPNGISGLANKINELGLDFGIWVEPEMVNVDSNLYRAHPDWSIDIPGINHSEGRNQRILNLTLEEVRDYLVARIFDLLSTSNIKYVKWDMNRIFTDYYAYNLSHQGELAHRYVLGLYDIMGRIVEEFPDVLFEGCASGGNRFDLGILCYMPQIWASDNTDAWCRAKIQTGYSFGYPMSVVSAHVSASPNHQTLRHTLLESRFNVAAFGVLGLEVNLSDLGNDDLSLLMEEIKCYKVNREVFFAGDYYRISNGCETEFGNCVYEWICVSKDKSKAIAFTMQDKAIANQPNAYLRVTGLDDSKIYRIYNTQGKYSIKHFGDLINTVAPVHVKPESGIHRALSHFIKMEGESENYIVSGSLLNNCGISLHQNYCGTGYDNEIRYYQDFASRMFFIEEVNEDVKEINHD